MRRKLCSCAAFTLLELLTVIVVIGILATLLIGISAELWKRVEKSSCTANLRGLYVGSASYVQDHGQWPQINPGLIEKDNLLYAQQWIKALAPYQIGQPNWLCPTTQKQLNNPDTSKPENVRVDYIACPFDAKQATPYLHPKQPWFIERGAVHAGGNLIIFTNGQVVSLTDTWGQPGESD